MYENDDESETWWRGMYRGEAVHNLSVLKAAEPAQWTCCVGLVNNSARQKVWRVSFALTPASSLFKPFPQLHQIYNEKPQQISELTKSKSQIINQNHQRK